MAEKGYTLNELAAACKKMAAGLIDQTVLFSNVEAINEEVQKFNIEVQNTARKQ
jgi:hypothetical protein